MFRTDNHEWMEQEIDDLHEAIKKVEKDRDEALALLREARSFVRHFEELYPAGIIAPYLLARIDKALEGSK